MEESSRRRFARYVHVKNWNFLFYCSNIAKSGNAMLLRMLSRLETCIVYSCIISFSCLRRWVLIEHIANAWGDLLVLVIVFCKIDKTDKYSNQNKLFSVHFHEMPGFKGKRKRGHSYISKMFLTKMQVKFSIFFHHGSLNVIGDKFRFVRSKLKSR